MKKLLSFLLFSLSSLFSQSIYPLPFTFDDNSFFISYVDVYKMSNGTKIAGALLNDTEYNKVTFGDKIIMPPICPQIKTLDEFINYKDISKQCYVFVKNLSQNNNFSQVKLDNGIKILVSETVIADDIQKTAFWYANAIIFYDDKLLGTMSYSSPFSNKEKFYLLLQTINLNKNIKNIDEYIKDGNRYIDKGFIDIA